jgi:ribose/xylose/arabinose/galactoside ABC-type transport system permease subunit
VLGVRGIAGDDLANAALGILAALGVGLCAGLFNGVVIIYGRVNAVIATLATYAGFRGLANLISDGRAQGYTGTDPLFVFLARGSIADIPTLIWVLVLIAVLVHQSQPVRDRLLRRRRDRRRDRRHPAHRPHRFRPTHLR